MESDADEPIHIPITDVFDLHTFPPRDVKPAIEAYLEEAHRKRLYALRIIHGKGIGVQRELVRSVLSRCPYVASFHDAPMEAGGWGATIVNLAEPGENVTRRATNAPGPMTAFANEFDAALADAESIAGPLTPDQFNWRGGPGRWSIGECLDHLALVNRMYIARIEEAMERGRRDKIFGSPPFSYSWLQQYLTRSMEPPPRLKVPAPKSFQPAPGRLDHDATLAAYRAVNRRLAAITGETAGLDLARIKVPSPPVTWWKWSLGVVIAACAVHDRRHLYQARQVLALPDFPKR